MIFAREVSDNLTSLVKKIDAATGENKKVRMGSFVVFCSDDEGLEKNLKNLVDKENIKNTILSIVNQRVGPPKYKVAKDADITVILYDRQTVKVNRAFRKGELTAQAIDAIVRDLPKILKAD
jgi:hypothetical protein